MSDLTDPLAWVAKAEEDYIVTRRVLRYKTALVSIASFHAQQCAEKYIKALLVSRQIDFPKTHDLIKLDELCSKHGIMLSIDLAKLHILTEQAVKVRYPDDTPTLAEAKEALEICAIVRKFARKFLGLR